MNDLVLPTENIPTGPGAVQDALLLDKLSNFVLTPYTIRGIFIMMTRIHYSDPANYGDLSVKLAPFVWSKDEKLRTLHIEYDYNYDPTKTDRRPAIFVGTGDVSFTRPVIDNMAAQTEDRAGEQYVYKASTNVIIRHIGKTPDESICLGDMTCQFFLGMRKLLQERLKVNAFDVLQQLASKPFERKSQEADQQFIVDLVMNLQYNASWLIVREGHRIKTVTHVQSLEDYVVRQTE